MSNTTNHNIADMQRSALLQIVSVNINRSNFKLTSLLQTSTADCILVQEPWWGNLVPRRSDTDPDGDPAWGTVAHPGWTVFTPDLSTSPDGHPRVLTFVRKSLTASCSVTPIALSHYDLLGLSLRSSGFHLLLLNFYHHVRHHHGNLSHLLEFIPDPSTPILLAGDFNSHSDTWSPGGKRPSPWAPALEHWLDDSGFISTVPDGAISRRSSTSLPSLIDFIFVNDAFLEIPSFPATCSVSFGDSLGSDHAALSLAIPFSTTAPQLHRPPGWRIDPELKDDWCLRFNALPIPEITNVSTLLAAGQEVLTRISDVSDSLFPKKSTPRSTDLPWWNRECSLACAALKQCHWRDRRHLSMALRMTIRNAKREWVDSLIDNPNVSLWDMAKWRKGRRLKEIPPIMTPDGLSHDPGLMSDAFLGRFFLLETHHSDPLTPVASRSLPQRPLRDVLEDEIQTALRSTSVSSAPGPSGIGYLLLRWAFEANPALFTHLFTHALRLGTHPWGDALVVIIPKPGKSDYTLAKAYRPISLLECCGKLLEKVVAARFSWEVDNLALIGNRQFGSRHHYSAPDAALCLHYKAKETIRHGRIGAVLLFDISRFFDHLDPGLTAATLHDLGIDGSTINWVRSFMTDRTARLSFNGHLSDAFTPSLGTPQGSPLSPILSAIVTSPLLHRSLDFTDGDLTLYVDDGCLYATGPTFISALQKVTRLYHTVLTLLHRMGLEADPDKTEIMFFHPRISPHHGAEPRTATIAIGDGKTLAVPISRSIRYLGVFFTPRLDWKLHVSTMANRARSTVKALGILGSSVRGISLMSWRKLFHALLLPVLTYGCTVWFTDTNQKSLTQILTVAQNEACRKMAGVFRTTPCNLTELLVSVPPIRFRLRHLLRNFGSRMSRLPPDHHLRSLPTSSRSVTLPPSYAPSGPLFPFIAEIKTAPIISYTPRHPSLPDWSRQRVTLHPYSPLHKPSLDALKDPNTTKILITSTSFHLPHIHLGIFAIFLNDTLHISDYTLDSSQKRCTVSALLHALRRLPTNNKLISIFYTDKSFPTYATSTYSSTHLPLSLALTHAFEDLLTDADLTFTGFWFSKAWAGARAGEWHPQRKAEATFKTIYEQPPLPSSRDRIFSEWRRNRAPFRRSDPRRLYSVFYDDPSPSLHPFVIGALSGNSRSLQSAAFQLATHHAFHADYSSSFRPTAGDNTTCPHCSASWTMPHVLFDCDTFWEARGLHLDPIYHNTIHHLFSSKPGGRRLVEFLHATQALLRPLPPRPTDPPWTETR
jgi:endonuclease/exonuclease/phosphatase (EEP) superfamily protein YafD